ncbi:MoaD/ThiS family protein [Sanguibacter antarcticus]|uniref:Molybdopterin converting factor small subunit n=1 Tax=Sanguibacter antarcticus TaxID=372484 RepID=A0A2A9E6I3_9MICO|nr:MoaD/ThiS family protein [Sanguibacter antarcticus]PFG33819.1 molybdopterin converting factor small subunit [Sanguibacter antarcticus]
MAETTSRLVTVRYYAAAADAAGLQEEEVPLPAAATVGDLKAFLVETYGDAMARVLASASFLADARISRDDSRVLGLTVDVLPPFAGG